MTFSGNLHHGQRNRQLQYGDVPASGATLTFQSSKVIKVSQSLSNRAQLSMLALDATCRPLPGREHYLSLPPSPFLFWCLPSRSGELEAELLGCDCRGVLASSTEGDRDGLSHTLS